MDDQPLSANANEKQDKKTKKTKFQYSQTTTSKPNTEVEGQTGMFVQSLWLTAGFYRKSNSLSFCLSGSLTEVSSSEQMSTNNTDLSADVSVNVFSNKTERKKTC